MNYSQKTQDLIDRQCRNVERADFVLDKPKAEELIMKTYDLFNLPRPKKVRWCVDFKDKDFQGSARSAWSAWSAWSARSARSAGAARSARSAWSARSAGAARSARAAESAGSAGAARSAGAAGSAWSAWSAWSARSAWAARSAEAAGSAWSAALDYDFEYYIFEYEYCENPDKDKLPNSNDKIYLKYCELLMQAKEAGLGYRIEWEDTLYLIPTPIVKINSLNQFHSDNMPAIRWKGGQEIFYLNGVIFPEKLWKEVTSGKMPFEKIMAIDDIDQRTQAMRFGDVYKFMEHTKSILLDKSAKKNELYKIPKEAKIFTQDAYYLVYPCPSTGKIYMSGVPQEIGEQRNADSCMAWKHNFSLDLYKTLTLES